MSFRISDISIEGFRGINKKLHLDVEGYPCLLFGDNGTGKTSILQAIEWCLCGKLPYLTAAEFSKEDALVNAFNPKRKAVVNLTIKGEDAKTIRVSRERKMYKSTKVGKTRLEVEIDGKVLKNEEAQNELTRVLGLSPEDFYVGTYLHQEAIRDLVVGSPDTRSKMIDKLLGLERLGELIKNLPVKWVSNKVKGVSEEVDKFKKQEEQIKLLSTEARKRLESYKEELAQKGILVEELDLQYLADHFSQIKDAISKIAGEMKVKVKEVKKPELDLNSIKSSFSELNAIVDSLSEKRFEMYKAWLNKYSNLENLKEKYEGALEKFSKLKEQDPGKLTANLDEINKKIQGLTSEIKDKRNAKDFLIGKNVEISSLSDKIEELKGNVTAIEDEFGNEGVIHEKIGKLSEENLKKIEEINRESKYNQLITTYFDYLKAIRVEKCPTCKSPIDYNQVLSNVEKEISGIKEAMLLQKLQKELDAIKKEKESNENALKKLVDYKNEIEKIESRLESMKGDLLNKGFKVQEPLIESLRQQINDIENSIQKDETKIDDLRKNRISLSSELEILKEILETVRSLERHIQSITGASSRGRDLLDELTRMGNELKTNLTKFEGLSQEISAIKESIERCERGISFFVEKRHLEELERALPALTRRIKVLEGRYSKMKEFEIAIRDVHQAVVSTRKTAIEAILSRLQTDVDLYYSELMCHPFYVDMRLVPEEERGKSLYRIRAYNKDLSHSTYVQTRFSGAQTNTVSLALFLAISKKFPSTLKLVILDDPIQSMDSMHKEALAAIMDKLATEKQVIIATQDKEFKEQLVRHLPKNSKILLFDKWDTEGPLISKP